MQQNHTSHSRQEMTTDIHRHHTVQSVPCIHWHQYVQQSGSDKICALQTFYCHAMLRCTQRNIVGCKEWSSTDHKTRLAHVTVEYLSYRPSPRWTHRAVRSTTNQTCSRPLIPRHYHSLIYIYVINYPVFFRQRRRKR